MLSRLRKREDEPSSAMTSSQTTAAPETRQHLVQVVPPVDIYENEEEIMLRADVPGVSSDGVDLRIERSVLTLAATSERLARVYRRSFTLSEMIDSGNVDAKLDAGVLTIRLRKREDMKPRRIPVK